MISYLKGSLLNKGKNHIILVANDVGYKIFINPIWYAELEIGQSLELYLHQHLREDVAELYGFKTHEELELFELLISISGVGPKSALGILSIARPREIKESIARGDSHLLTKVSGIGRKTAERVILELQEKIGSIVPAGALGAMASGGDDIDALVVLGYSPQQARQALAQVGAEIKDTSTRIREALKLMGK